MLKVKKLNVASMIPKLGGVPLFDRFLDLAKFSVFDFPNLDNF